MKKRVAPDYILLGNKVEEDTLDFVEYDKGLFRSDSTVLRHRKGLLETPKVVSEVTLAILEDLFSQELVEFNYPFYIYKGMFEWRIEGTCQYSMIDEDCMYFGGSLVLELQRSNGMIQRIECNK